MLRGVKTWALAMAIGAIALPAGAAVIINSANSGYNFEVDYTGQVNGSSTDQIGALASFTFTGVTNNGLTYNFGYSLTNNSTVDSRIRSFGMDTTGTVTSLSSTGIYDTAETDGHFPEGLGNRDLCFIATGNGQCNGGPGGLTSNPDQTGTGSFSLTFAQVMESISFDNFAVRFQSINPGLNGGGTSGVGLGSLVDSGGGPVSTAPEPATWLMMLGGFGLVGFALRRRRERALLPQIA
jgi:hypothetical protein